MRVRFTQLPGVDWGQSRAFRPTHRRNALHSVCKQQAFFKYRELGNVIPVNVYLPSAFVGAINFVNIRSPARILTFAFARATRGHARHTFVLDLTLFQPNKKKSPGEKLKHIQEQHARISRCILSGETFFSFPEIARPYATAQHQVWLLRKLENQFFERLVCTFRASHEYQNRD